MKWNVGSTAYHFFFWKFSFSRFKSITTIWMKCLLLLLMMILMFKLLNSKTMIMTMTTTKNIFGKQIYNDHRCHLNVIKKREREKWKMKIECWLNDTSMRKYNDKWFPMTECYIIIIIIIKRFLHWIVCFSSEFFFLGNFSFCFLLLP